MQKFGKTNVCLGWILFCALGLQIISSIPVNTQHKKYDKICFENHIDHKDIYFHYSALKEKNYLNNNCIVFNIVTCDIFCNSSSISDVIDETSLSVAVAPETLLTSAISSSSLTVDFPPISVVFGWSSSLLECLLEAFFFFFPTLFFCWNWRSWGNVKVDYNHNKKKIIFWSLRSWLP